MSKRILSLLLIFGLFFACGDDDDDSSGPETGQPPEIFAPTASFTGPQSDDPNAQLVNTYVTMASAQAFTAVPLTALATQLPGDASRSGDTWTWSYTYNDPETGYTLTVTVTATQQADGWYWTFTWDGTIFDNWMAIEGFTNLDGTGGWWKWHDPDTDVVERSVVWEGDDTSGMMEWYEGDFQTGGILELIMEWSEADGTTTWTLTVPEEIRYVVSENADGSGDFYIYEWENEDWVLVFEAHWTGAGSGTYTDYTTDPPTVRTWP